MLESRPEDALAKLVMTVVTVLTVLTVVTVLTVLIVETVDSEKRILKYLTLQFCEISRMCVRRWILRS